KVAPEAGWVVAAVGGPHRLGEVLVDGHPNEGAIPLTLLAFEVLEEAAGLGLPQGLAPIDVEVKLCVLAGLHLTDDPVAQEDGHPPRPAGAVRLHRLPLLLELVLVDEAEAVLLVALGVRVPDLPRDGHRLHPADGSLGLDPEVTVPRHPQPPAQLAQA